jgi:hypothetical protein
MQFVTCETWLGPSAFLLDAGTFGPKITTFGEEALKTEICP